MGSAIAGMHYIGIASMRIAATIHWNQFYVILSIIIAFIASFGALLLSFKLRDDMSGRGYLARGGGGIIMGIAISGMHYTGMFAMTFSFDQNIVVNNQQLLATEGLATAIILGTLAVLGIALAGSNIERALFRKTLLNNSLEAGIKARDEFLSIASHELKTPLTVIKLNVEMSLRQLKREEWDKDRFEFSLHKTSKSLHRIIRLVNDMLDVARIGAGKLSLNKEYADLEIIIEDVIENMTPEYAAAGIDDIKFHPVKAKGHFDVFRIEQVFINLLSNALKYGQGNPVEVIMKLQEPNTVCIAVKDQGFGISEENQKKIFERFERVNSPSEIAGLGLGLSIVEELVKSHGGNIWVESELGKGSTFYIQLPLS
jgi:signal transduction histidine kinase